ncbi:hypothetical protein TVAG_375280 [Trichomonas vaginalis G3]|uniref:Uncharacterized protein n=1 Tax=Trichomonas vaginalis (strain ATCC PRA-98 / G3) TaxID=412133 RepID=A2FH06_TRIV3|nr:hypothetical protein TVAGG3_0859320 [Trichomonas vaginalis G3]EAX95819.1 hypothetical protein TVAG_375280 [Trichomonas vaginalis G3]KAI5500553.1 hypothetical protein TVAGG3_0859320 [Trichomonas vaginalis G3]|eukprot:XP_001308749.1 hypothetical protein [Trichomonas vaginalis G3]
MTHRLFGFINKVKEAAKILNAEEESEYEEEYEEEETKEKGENESDISDIDLDEVEELLKETKVDTETKEEVKVDPVIEEKRKQKMQYFEAFTKIQNLFPAMKLLDNPDALITELESIQQKQTNLNSEREKFTEILDAIRSLDFVEQDLKASQENINVAQSTTEKLKSDLDKAKKLKLAARSKAAELQSLIQQNSIRANDLKSHRDELEKQIATYNEQISATKKKIEVQQSTNQQYQNTIEQLQQSFLKSKEESESIQYELEEEDSRLKQVLAQLDAAQNQSREERLLSENQEITSLEEEYASLQRAITASEKQASLERNGMSLQEIEKKLTELTETHRKLSTKVEVQKEEVKDERKDVTALLISYVKKEKDAEENLKSYFQWSDGQIKKAKDESLGFWGKTSRLLARFTDSWSSYLLQAVDN